MVTTTIDAAIARAKELRPHYVHMIAMLYPYKMSGSLGITADRYMRLYFDPEALEQWELDWAAGRILVQIEKYYRRHAARQRGREEVTWSLASEISITDTLAEERIRFPPNTLFPDTFGLNDGQSVEENWWRLFNMCMGRKQVLQQQLGMDLPNFGSAGSEQLQDWELPEDADVPTIDYFAALMLQREFIDKGPSTPGIGAGSEIRTTNEDRNSAVDWRIEFRSLIGSVASNVPGLADYSFLMPDPEYGLHPGIIMPGMCGRRAKVCVVIDSSGSMGDTRIAQAIAETGEILRSLGGEIGVRVFSCDSAVHTTGEIFHQEQISIIGGGGTDIGVGIKAAAETSPDMIVCVTDCDTPWPKKGPHGIPVIVVRVGTGKTPTWVYKVFDVSL